MKDARDFPRLWTERVNGGEVDAVLALYGDGALLLSTFQARFISGREELRAYFAALMGRAGSAVRLDEESVVCQERGGLHLVSGLYAFCQQVACMNHEDAARFSFVLDLQAGGPIVHHHSSLLPD